MLPGTCALAGVRDEDLLAAPRVRDAEKTAGRDPAADVASELLLDVARENPNCHLSGWTEPRGRRAFLAAPLTEEERIDLVGAVVAPATFVGAALQRVVLGALTVEVITAEDGAEQPWVVSVDGA